MRILVIGGTGFLGPHILRALHGHELTVLHRGRKANTLPEGVRSLHGDRSQLPNMVRQYHPDAVIDCICASAADAGTLIEAFGHKSCRVVMLSSADVYRAHEVMHGREQGPLQPTPIPEEGDLRTYRYPYRGQKIPAYEWVNDDYDKILAEQALAPLHPTIVRLPMVYGPGDPLHRFKSFLQQMDAGQSTIQIEESLARWKGCWGYVENVAHAIALAVTSDRSAGRTYNVAEADAPEYGTWLEFLAEAAEWRGKITHVAEQEMPFNYAQHWALDSARIRSELSYREPLDRIESLRRTVAWERESLSQKQFAHNS
ncbi:MAG TPA: NAD-dependent epimerase/dehydratase family protein [Bryobacteraceae bacterium]|nr:NAD-dependent epimerase/dehydratase family protein [Bryobacteraceae bacterium]